MREVKTFIPRIDAMPPAQQAVWRRLGPTVGLGFVLYGGTAAALLLGHRKSIDFDFFTDKQLDKALLRRSLPFLDSCTVLQDQVETLAVETQPEGSFEVPVKVSFFGSISFGRVDEPMITQDGIAVVASLADLLATKLKVIMQRAEAKDYQDIAAILRAGLPLEVGLASALAMFGATFQPSECLRALVYFQGGDLGSLSVIDRETLIASATLVVDLPAVRLVSKTLTTPRTGQ